MSRGSWSLSGGNSRSAVGSLQHGILFQQELEEATNAGQALSLGAVREDLLAMGLERQLQPVVGDDLAVDVREALDAPRCAGTR